MKRERHGHTGRDGQHLTPTYQSWAAMHGRCRRKNHPYYYRYGGRGISVCERWRSFSNFLADMGERPPGKTLDRIDGDGNYEPANCRWATVMEQHAHKCSNRYLTAHGETLTIADWTRRLGGSENIIRQRLRKGWSVEDAVSVPVIPPERSRTWRKKAA